TAIFWLLVAASVVIAAFVWNRLPEQRTLSNIAQWLIRLVMGAFWWQQSLWKLPPLYTDHAEAAFGETGLAYWMGLMGKHAAILVAGLGRRGETGIMSRLLAAAT